MKTGYPLKLSLQAGPPPLPAHGSTGRVATPAWSGYPKGPRGSGHSLDGRPWVATQNTSGYPQIPTKQGKVYRLGGYIPAIVDTSYGMGSILKGIDGRAPPGVEPAA